MLYEDTMQLHRFIIRLTSVTAMLLLAASIPTTAQIKAMTQKTNAWFDGKQWLKGLKMTPHSSINKTEFARQYQRHTAYWDAAFKFLRDHDLTALALGKQPIDGENVFVSVTEDSTKDFAKTRWESHRKYADIQLVVRGEEKIGVCALAKATVTEAYDAAKDIAHYDAEGTQYSALPGTFFIFFPGDAHRPNISPGGNAPDKKVVIKVRVAD